MDTIPAPLTSRCNNDTATNAGRIQWTGHWSRLIEGKLRLQWSPEQISTEFSQHEKVANALKADVYFAHPYCAWERGLNENTNGLLRPYFPKGSNFKTISDAKIRPVEKRLNE